jgi:hypothetical protein
LNNKTPDIAFIPKGGVCSSFWLVMIGEIKLHSNGTFSEEEIGQIINYGHRILESQSNRNFIYVFLTDCSYIQFFKVSQTLDIECSPVFQLWDKKNF